MTVADIALVGVGRFDAGPALEIPLRPTEPNTPPPDRGQRVVAGVHIHAADDLAVSVPSGWNRQAREEGVILAWRVVMGDDPWPTFTLGRALRDREHIHWQLVVTAAPWICFRR